MDVSFVKKVMNHTGKKEGMHENARRICEQSGVADSEEEKDKGRVLTLRHTSPLHERKPEGNAK